MKTIRLDSKTLEALLLPLDESLRMVEAKFDVRAVARGGDLTIEADGEDAARRETRVADLFSQLAALHAQGVPLRRDDIKTAINIAARQESPELSEHFVDSRLKPSARKTVVAKSRNQRHYINAMRENDLVFGVGPAGTGKTYLAVAMAISLLNEKRIQRILLCRPAVEAGEKLGFLPGDIAAKVDPYLRPLYDALHDMLEPERIEQLVERGTIEVAPLAFMRGRTLNDAFIILDEAQNTTPEQMKMFLTRIGLDSKAAVTGDVTQIDLPAQRTSGLVEALDVVSGIVGIARVHFDETDVVRHPLVQRIVIAYDERAARAKERGTNGNPDERP